MSIYRTKLTIRAATRADTSDLAHFIAHEPYVHKHLDWRSPLEWLGTPPFLVALEEDAIQGVLACPPDPENIAWIRLFGARSTRSQEEVFRPLIEHALNVVNPVIGDRIVAIVLQDWFERLLVESGFSHTQKIIVLEWMGQLPGSKPLPSSILIRPMVAEDLPEVHQVDKRAFAPLWHNSLASLSLAYDQSSWSMVAEDENGIVAYQISTTLHLTGHLARLAVLPEYQHRHIGYELVRELILHFKKAGIWRITVNTQNDNSQSLALYQSLGFRLTGEKFPVYELI